MAKLYNILKDIWRNYNVPLVMSFLFQLIIFRYKSEMDLVWFFISYFIAAAPLLLIIIYAIKKYKNK